MCLKFIVNIIIIFIASKPENAEIYAIKNDYASVQGGDEVWIRGSKMIGNRKNLLLHMEEFFINMFLTV